MNRHRAAASLLTLFIWTLILPSLAAQQAASEGAPSSEAEGDISRETTLPKDDVSKPEATVEQPSWNPDTVLPGTQVHPLSPALVVVGSALVLGGATVSSIGLYQRVEDLGGNGWETLGIVGGSLALGGFLFILIGGLTTAPYDQVPVEMPSP